MSDIVNIEVTVAGEPALSVAFPEQEVTAVTVEKIGPKGNQGVQGDQGEKGNQGDQGGQGLQGNTGLTGLKGDAGADTVVIKTSTAVPTGVDAINIVDPAGVDETYHVIFALEKLNPAATRNGILSHTRITGGYDLDFLGETENAGDFNVVATYLK